MKTTLSPTEQARFNMVEQQIRPWNVLDTNVLQLLLDTPREKYVPPAFQHLAFHDIDIPLTLGEYNSGESMLSPKLEARLTQELQLKQTDSVLEIGTGSGYQTALLSGLAAQVLSIEIDSKLAEFAQNNLLKHKKTNVKIEVGDARNGWGSTEFDAILVTGSVPSIPDSLKYQLRVGGRLVVIVGQAPMMTAYRITRTAAANFQKESLFDTLIKPLRGTTVSQFKF